MLDRHHPAVIAFVHDVEAEIARLHGTLERVGLEPAAYDVARGQIKSLRWTLDKIIPEQEDELLNA